MCISRQAREQQRQSLRAQCVNARGHNCDTENNIHASKDEAPEVPQGMVFSRMTGPFIRLDPLAFIIEAQEKDSESTDFQNAHVQVNQQNMTPLPSTVSINLLVLLNHL